MKLRTLTAVCALCAAIISNTASAGYAEYLQLNGLDNHAVLEDNGNPSDNIVQLRSTNGTFATIQFEMPTDILAIDLGAGDDQLVVEGLQLGVLTAELMVFGQGGDDLVVLRGLDTLSNVYSDDVNGDNTLDYQQSLVSGDLHVTDGSGKQTVRFAGEVGGSVFIQSSDGGSDLRIGTSGVTGLSARIDGALLINHSGYGDDIVRLGGFVDGDVFIDSGHGAFDFSSIFSSVGSLYTSVDSGTSRVFLGDFSSDGESHVLCAEGETDLQVFFSFLNNGLFVNNGLGFDKARIEGSVVGNQVAINNGDGGSSTILRDRFRALNVPQIQVQNGSGSDTYELALGDREASTVGSFSANNGRGNSTIIITGSSPMESVTSSARWGLDVLSLDGVNIANNLIAFHSGGGSDVDIHDSNIGGNVDIDSKGRTDYVSIFDSSVGGTTNLHTGGGRDSVTVSNNVFSSDFVADGGAGYDIFATTNDNSFGGIEYVTRFEFIYEY